MDLARPHTRSPRLTAPPTRSARRILNTYEPTVTLSVALANDSAPPTEFCIFTAGKVVTTKGTFLFDAEAAKSVLAEYATHGIDLMIDYDHASLGVGTDPALSGKAAGWFNIELRGGDLWAVNVRWTPAAATALSAREWRFMSPAFSEDDGRITSLLNVALTNLPATRQLEPLMAANARGKIIMASDSGISPKLIAGALDAVANKDAKSALDLMKQFLAQLLGGDPDATTEDAPPPVGDGGADEATEMPAAASIAASMLRASTFVAAGRLAISLTGAKDVGSAMTELARRSTLALGLEAEIAKLATDRATLENGERRTLVGQIVKLGYEIPALAWSDDKGVVLSDEYAKMPIERLRDRVTKLTAAGPRAGAPLPPKGAITGTDATGSKEFVTSFGTVTLTASQLIECERANAKPEVFAANMAKRSQARGGK